MSPRPLSGVVSVDIDVPWEVRSALAPGFDVDVERLGSGRLEVSWESAATWNADANFRLYLSGGEGLIDTRLLAHRVGGEDGYFALLFAPVIDVDSAVARDVVLVLDHLRLDGGARSSSRRSTPRPTSSSTSGRTTASRS